MSFSAPAGGHFRRSNYSQRFFRPAADGWYLPQNGKAPRPAVPVLVTECDSFPGRSVPPWPAAEPGKDFVPPTGRGLIRLVNDEHTGRCPACSRGWPRRIDGTLIAHAGRQRSRCEGSGQAPAEDTAVASWLPVLPGLTPPACGTAFRRGWMRTAFPRSTRPNGWATRCQECTVSTGTSAQPCAPILKPPCKHDGSLRYATAPGYAHVLLSARSMRYSEPSELLRKAAL